MEHFELNDADTIKDKVVVISGANTGIGFEIARILSLKGAMVILACRDETRGKEAQNNINGKCEYINLNLQSFKSIEVFSDQVMKTYPKVDVLINNAGVMRPPFTRTKEHLELTFAVNYIGYYLLSHRLIPMMKDVQGSRVVNMSSISQYRINHFDWANINSEFHYDKMKTYALSNLFRMMFTIELNTKLREKNYQTLSVACHPGVSITNIVRNMPKILSNSIFTKILNTTVFQSPDKAAIPAIMAATSKLVKGGEFVGLDTKRQFRGRPKVVEPNKLAMDPILREQLWNKSVEITGVDLE